MGEDDKEIPVKKQFQLDENNQFQKTLLKFRQNNEYTRINKDFEGLCYGCFKNKYVMASVFDACQRCVDKRGSEPLLSVVNKKMHQFCFLCETFQQDIFVLNARMCERCNGIIAKAHKRYRKTGRYDIDPFWRKMRTQFGKDYKELMFDPSLSFRR